MNHYLVVVGFAVWTFLGASCSESRYPEALEPEAALGSFQLDSAFTIGLAASEPLIMDPVDLVFDRKGHAYVVEMPDYPFKPEPGEGEGRIRLLEDENGDGEFDKATLFADGISEATSVLPWKDGLLVAAAPYILYLKDTDGDGRSDTREELFSGFFEKNSEAQITNLRFGIDNWIYASNNGQPGEVSFAGKPDAPPLSVRGADFRFRLDRGLFEAETGAAQFGQTFDDWGHRFMTQNTIHVQQAVIPWRYLHRHPYLPSDRAVVDISDHGLLMFQRTPPPYWRAERTRRRQREYQERGLDRVEYAEDHFTGCSGGTVYAGDAFPDTYYGNLFTGDVSGNLVHRDVLIMQDDQPVYRAKRSGNEKEREFLSSTDPWFRPVGFSVGPDGALYIIDMYRQHIETPLSIPEDLKQDMDFMAGSDRGRIYRVQLKDHATGDRDQPDLEAPLDLDVSLNLETLESRELVEILAHPGRWWRLQAQQLLLERQDASVVPALKRLFAEQKDPRVRLHALYTLEGLSALDAQLVTSALNDPHPGLREHGLILAERFPECLPEIRKSVNDPSARVALQACLSLGEFPPAAAVQALSEAVTDHSEDRWFRMAILSSDAGSSTAMLDELIASKFFTEPSPGKTRFLEDLSSILAARGRQHEIARLLSILSRLDEESPWQLAALTGLGKGVAKHPDKTAVVTGMRVQLTNLRTTSSPETAAVIDRLLGGQEKND